MWYVYISDLQCYIIGIVPTGWLQHKGEAATLYLMIKHSPRPYIIDDDCQRCNCYRFRDHVLQKLFGHTMGVFRCSVVGYWNKDTGRYHSVRPCMKGVV